MPLRSSSCSRRVSTSSPAASGACSSAPRSGQRLHLGAVEALASNEERADVASCLAGLVRQELVRPYRTTYAGEEGLASRYSSSATDVRRAAEAVRGDLHEGHVAWLESRAGEAEELLATTWSRRFATGSELGTTWPHDAELGARASQLLASLGDAHLRGAT